VDLPQNQETSLNFNALPTPHKCYRNLVP